MGVAVSTARLGREMARRGWNNLDLARASGLSPATITAARSGKPASPHTVTAIARALSGAAPADGVDLLLG